MFTQFKNIDTAFQHIKRFSIYLILANVLILCFGMYKSYEFANKAQNTIHILYNGKVLEAIATDRKSNIPVELRDHIKTFHQYFFSMDPDEKAILSNITKALYLADESAKKQYDNLKESGYYSNLISANISQEIEVDSIALDLNIYPYSFRCYATQRLIRSSSTVVRKLVTIGQVRDLKSQTDNNPHGFLIQRWETISNQDVPLNL
ncbi:conjugative transposon protein TraK [Pedobacter gandavensis]|uniref:conjugative transposon protein TraK n=1 Tax=Pedobacter gandavensis TaxID=2679963 RepID=UPI002479C595|nr:conjugative transposon protein TraK [Pedobacter gandavensis]WGQ09732.1 conjugative transposon protein TraK [Pedobacter gandavensis]